MKKEGSISVSCRAKWAVQESQRDSILKPRVARNEPPWVIVPNHSQPQRGCCHSVPADPSPRPQRRWRCYHFRTWTQGSPEKSWQPCAEGHNPFGIELPGHCSKLRCAQDGRRQNEETVPTAPRRRKGWRSPRRCSSFKASICREASCCAVALPRFSGVQPTMLMPKGTAKVAQPQANSRPSAPLFLTSSKTNDIQEFFFRRQL